MAPKPKSLPLLELIQLFPDDATAEAWFVRARWPDGVHCPACGSLDVQPRPTRKPQPYRCRDCRKDFSAKTGSLMHASNLGYQKWALALHIVTSNPKGVAYIKLHRDLAISRDTAWHLIHRINEAYEDSKALPFAGPTEVDETFVGGLEKNKHADKKLRAGRGTVGKATVVGAKDRATNQVVAKVVKGRDRATLHQFVLDHTQPGSVVYTDDLTSYLGMPDRIHVGDKYSGGPAHTNGIEGFWSVLKRRYNGVHHYMSHKHLPRYVNAIAGRHNAKDLDTLDQMAAMAAGMDGKRLKYTDLVAGKAPTRTGPKASQAG